MKNGILSRRTEEKRRTSEKAERLKERMSGKSGRLKRTKNAEGATDRERERKGEKKGNSE